MYGVRIRVIRSAARTGSVCGARSSPVLDWYHQMSGVVPGTNVMLSPTSGTAGAKTQRSGYRPS